MRLSTSFVAVRKITSSTSPSEFDIEKIEHLAHQIVKSEGIIRPLVLNRTSLESYEVIDGHFEYHAAFRAREIDLRRAEMIAAYIIDPENDDVSEAIIEQIKLLRQSTSINIDKSEVVSTKTTYIQPEISHSHEVDEILKSILSKLSAYESLLNGLQKSLMEVVEMSEKIKSIKTLSDNSHKVKFEESNLELIIEKTIEKYILKTKSSLNNSKKLQYSQEQEKLIIDGLNTFDISQITEKLSQAGYTTAKSIAQKICDCRRIAVYDSIEDLMTRKASNGKPFFTKTHLTKLLKIW